MLISILIMILLPAVLLGLAPVLVSAWFSVLPRDAAFLSSEGHGGAGRRRAGRGAGGRAACIVLRNEPSGPSFRWSGSTGYAFVREALRAVGQRNPSCRREAGPTAAARSCAGRDRGERARSLLPRRLVVLAAWPLEALGRGVADLRNPQALILPALPIPR